MQKLVLALVVVVVILIPISEWHSVELVEDRCECCWYCCSRQWGRGGWTGPVVPPSSLSAQQFCQLCLKPVLILTLILMHTRVHLAAARSRSRRAPHRPKLR